VRTAVRFPLRMEIIVTTPEREYRAVTEDVSSNGVLFTAEEVPPVGSTVEFRLTMPAAVMGSREDVLLHCIGRIVRHERAIGSSKAAAVIDEYSLKAEHL
jgi:PilZ domain